MSVHRCSFDGVLVGAERPIGPSVHDYVWPGNRLGLGCGRLMCQRCGEVVRSWTGAVPAMPLSAGERTALIAADDLSPFLARRVLVAAPDGRAYACKCHDHTEFYSRGLTEGGDAWEMATRPPWRCAGHPQLVPPDELDDLAVDDRMDCDALVEAEFSAPADHGRWGDAWLSRLWHLLRPSPLADRLDAAIARRLVDPRPAVRLRAIDFYDRNPAAAGGAALLAALRDHPDLFRGVANPFPSKGDLWWWGMQALVGRLVVVRDAETAAFAAACIAAGPVPAVLKIALADPDDPRVADVFA